MQIQVSDISVHYDIVGSGKTILFLHGWGAPYGIYRGFTMELVKQYRLILLDFPGFGGSKEPESAWDVGRYADFVLAFLREIQEQPEIIMAHSFGGRVSIKLLTERKDQCAFVNQLILMDAAGVKNIKSRRQKWQEFTYKTARKIWENTIVSRMYPDMLDEMRAKRGSSDYNQASPVMRQVLVKAVNEDQTEWLSGIKLPTLLIWGDADTATPMYQAKTMKREIPDSILVVLEGAGHFSFIEQTPEAISAIREFIK